MFDSREQIIDQLRAGEDGYAEFKEVRFGTRGVISPNTEDMAAELVALANAAGGVVFLGIDDSGTVRGIPTARVNAVAHRDYAIAGSKIRLFLFSDRLELIQPWQIAQHPSHSTTCLTVHSRAINCWSISYRGSAASAPDRYSSNPAAKACGKSWKMAKHIRADAQSYELFGDELRLTLWAKMRKVSADGRRYTQMKGGSADETD